MSNIIVGALFGTLVTLTFTEWLQARQRVRARKGYARLLDAEIEANERVANELNKHSSRLLVSLLENVQYVQYAAPSIEVWPQISVNLAPLIKAEEFTSINDYYRRVRVLVDLKVGHDLAAKKGESVGNYLSTLSSLAQDARLLLFKYANPPRRAWWFGI